MHVGSVQGLFLAKASSFQNGNLKPNLESFTYQHELILKAFEDGEKKFALNLACAFPKDGHGIGYFMKTVVGGNPEIMKTLLGADLPARDLRACVLPHIAWPRKFIEAWIRDHPKEGEGRELAEEDVGERSSYPFEGEEVEQV